MQARPSRTTGVIWGSRTWPTVDARADLLWAVPGGETAPLSEVLLRNGRFVALEWNGRTLRIARDPFGEAPLFYRRIGEAMWFASELRPLLDLASAEPDLA